MALTKYISDQGERIEILDRLRGFALLGIFLMNIPSLAGVSSEMQPALRSFLYILMRDSSRPLFAVMFGISVCLIYDRTREKQRDPYVVLLRRFLFLGIFGTLHGYAIWAGDILLMFAMGGVALLLFLKMKDTWLLFFGIFFWLVYTVGIDFFNNYTSYFFNLETSLNAVLGAGEILAGYDFFLSEFISMVNHLGFLFLGMFFYRKGALSFISENRKNMWWAAIGFFTIGFAGKTTVFFASDQLFLNSLDDFFPFVLSIGVMLGVILCGTSTNPISKLLCPFTPIGKMTFTNYLMQSLVFVTIFTGSGSTFVQGIGIWSEPDYHFALGAGLVLFIIQMIFSHFWLRKFYYGPFEWLWRIGTYGKMVAMRK
ncbi:hypothetical protein CR203_05635 [Salipaludibacillus neizhouensis]|uniref:DUF418 domain-containing protein n=1 Tax=Salipaludibacillus neizhouensis TaxID=885475 RepID=A0A3A9K5X9_9BACI|nr:DUF418 domain-containing protein [Salipaludibacillus neizhouensis]RKL67987.1 hypothetical protein CR203_05635 [Salipaludibacillus neizhouensis]